MQGYICGPRSIKAFVEGRKKLIVKPMRYQPTRAGTRWRWVPGGQGVIQESCHWSGSVKMEEGNFFYRHCPLWNADKLLYVQEAFFELTTGRVIYKADSSEEDSYLYNFSPPVMMKPSQSRVMLSLLDLDICQVHDLSPSERSYHIGEAVGEKAFASLWDEAYGKGMYDSNYFVWKISVKLVYCERGVYARTC
jgi:hypothetical protein